MPGTLQRGPGILGMALQLLNADQFNSAMKRSQRSLVDTERATDKAGRSVDALGGIFKKAALVAAPIATFAALRKAWEGGVSDMDNLAKLRVRGLAGINAGLSDLSYETGVTDDALTEAALLAKDKGVAESEMLAFLTQSAHTAGGAFQDLGGTVRATAVVSEQFNEDLSNAQRIQEGLWVAVKDGAGSMEELADIMGNMGPTANAVGLTWQELAAMASMFQRSGVGGAKDLMAINMALSGIIEASDDAKQEAQRLGIEWSAAAVRSMGFGAWVQHVSDRLAGMEKRGNNTGESLRKLGLAGRSMGMFDLLTRRADDYNATLDRVRNSTGELERMWSDRQKDPGFQMQRMAVAAGELWDSFGGGLLVGVAGGRQMGDLADSMQKNARSLEDAGMKAGATLRSSIEWAVSPDGMPKLIGMAEQLAVVLKPIGWFADSLKWAAENGRAAGTALNRASGGQGPKGHMWMTDPTTGEKVWAQASVLPNGDLVRSPEDITADRRSAIELREKPGAGVPDFSKLTDDQRLLYGIVPPAPDMTRPTFAPKDSRTRAEIMAARAATERDPKYKAVMAAERDRQRRLQLDLNHKLTVDKAGNVTHSAGSARAAGAGAADVQTNYRMWYVTPGEGINAVRPLPMNVVMPHVRRPD